MPDASSINPLSKVDLGGSLGTFGSIALVIAIAVVILVLIALIIYIFIVKKQYWIRVHVFKLVGNTPTRIAIHVGKEVPFGMAGDKLWRIAPNKALVKAFKILKWLPVGRLQTAPNEFWYWIREDGEWINFTPSDIDDISRKMKVKFVQEDLKLQRLATERLLEQRLMDKTFWEKWGNTIMMVIIFLVIAICMVLIFFQFGKILDKLAPLIDKLTQSQDLITRKCGEGIWNTTSGGSLIPA